MSETTLPHLPVLYHDIILALRPVSPGLYIDGTVGAGGHAWGILDSSSPAGRLLGLDVDPQALAFAQQRLAPFADRAILVQGSYTTLTDQLHRLGWEKVQGIVLDLGASSIQFDTPERGFSFKVDGPLDMRFDPGNSVTAASLVNNLPENELANVLWTYGEERRARHLAKVIIGARPINTTRQLGDLVARAIGSRNQAIHPATRTFQALRIAVNHELEAIEEVLPQAVSALAPGGRLAVIAFHSLEDRIVKQFMKRESRDCICPPEQPVCTCQHRASIIEITRHPITPEAEEIKANPRARSARLRVAEKVTPGITIA
jgi:16S rRNA (cytosine1402-N4)-methyltransferase